MTPRVRSLVAALGLGAFALPADAAAHAVIRLSAGTLSYVSDDAASASRLEVRGGVAGVSVFDPGAVGGMSAPDVCRPGRTNEAGDVVEYVCPGAGVAAVRADLGPNEDAATFDVPWHAQVDAGSGADEVTAGPGGATLRGDQGRDVLRGGAGADTVEAADGVRDDVSCGAGADRVAADTVDLVATDCEQVERTYVAPPAGGGEESDAAAPELRLSAARASRTRVTLLARASEDGELTASAFLQARGVNTVLRSVTRRAAAGRAVRLTIRLTRSQRRRVEADLRRGRRPAVRLTVAATDAAGNVRTRALRLRVRR